MTIKQLEGGRMSQFSHLVCLDMDRVLVDHLSTWQFVYDKLGISNDESFELYNQGLLDEWDWIKLDIALIKDSIKDRDITDEELRTLMEGMPMMKNWHLMISELLNDGAKVAIISGGLQQQQGILLPNFHHLNHGSVDGEVLIVTQHNVMGTVMILS